MKCRFCLLFVLFVAMTFIAMPILAGEPGTFKPEGKGYFIYHHDASEGDGQTNSFDFTRMYIGTKYYVSEEFTIRYLSDISHASGGGKFEVFTKYAYLDWKLSDKLNVAMGLQGTNNWSMPEKAWGYRQVLYSPMEVFGKFWGSAASDYKSFLEDWANSGVSAADSASLMAKKSSFSSASKSTMGSSADMGVALKFKPSDVAYVNVMIRNGLGYKKVEDDMYKNIQFRAGTYMMDKAVHLSGYVEVEPWKGVDADGASTGYLNLQWDAMASFTQKDKFTIGFNANSKTFDSIEPVTAMCISVFGHGYLMPEKLKALFRYDMYNTGFNDVEIPSGSSTPETNGNRIIAGLDCKVHEKVSIILNIQMVTYEDADIDPTNSLFITVYFKI